MKTDGLQKIVEEVISVLSPENFMETLEMQTTPEQQETNSCLHLKYSGVEASGEGRSTIFF